MTARLLPLMCLLLAFFVPAASPQATDDTSPRRALVLGNDNYPGHRLQNARNDARAIADVLKDLGYLTTLKLDLTRTSLAGALERFASSVSPGDVAVVYYAGHGLQLEGENYLIPVDFVVSRPEDVHDRAYSLSDLLAVLRSHGVSTEVVILDACRDNPFLDARSLRGSGWAPVATSAGTYLAFGTSPGSTAADEPTQRHGRFTSALLHHLADPHVDLDQMFQEVRAEVIDESHGSQIPWTASSLIGSLHIDPAQDGQAAHLPAHFMTEVNASFSESPRSVLGLSVPAAKSTAKQGQDDPALMDTARAAALARVGRFHEAISILEKVLVISPAPPPLRLLGLLLYLIGDHRGATAAFDRALSLDPGDTAAATYQCLLADSRAAIGRQDSCEEVWRLAPPPAQASIYAALQKYQQGNLSGAQDEATRAATLSPDNHLVQSLKQALSELH